MISPNESPRPLPASGTPRALGSSANSPRYRRINRRGPCPRQVLLARSALEGEREAFAADVQSLHELGVQALLLCRAVVVVSGCCCGAALLSCRACTPPVQVRAESESVPSGVVKLPPQSGPDSVRGDTVACCCCCRSAPSRRRSRLRWSTRRRRSTLRARCTPRRAEINARDKCPR